MRFQWPHTPKVDPNRDPVTGAYRINRWWPTRCVSCLDMIVHEPMRRAIAVPDAGKSVSVNICYHCAFSIEEFRAKLQDYCKDLPFTKGHAGTALRINGALEWVRLI